MGEEIQYWKIAPGENAMFWEDCREKGVIGIGWCRLGDLKQYENLEDLKRAYKETSDLDEYKNPEIAIKRECKKIWNFYKKIKKDDIIVANKGISKIVGIGVVIGDYYFDKDKIPKDYKSNNKICYFRDVKWISTTDKDKGYDISGKIKQNWQHTVVLLDRDRELIKNVITELNLNIGHFASDNENIPDLYQNLLLIKKQIILYGPPGTGKTYQARRLAVEIIKEAF